MLNQRTGAAAPRDLTPDKCFEDEDEVKSENTVWWYLVIAKNFLFSPQTIASPHAPQRPASTLLPEKTCCVDTGPQNAFQWVLTVSTKF